MELVLHNTNLMKCDVFLMVELVSATITVYLIFKSNKVTPLSPVTHQNFIRLNPCITFVNGNVCGIFCFA